MTPEQREIVKIALHESGHAVAAWALGIAVSRVILETVADTVIGTTYLHYLPDTPISYRVATLLAGTMAVRTYQNAFHLSVPPAAVFQQPAPRGASHPRSLRLADDIRKFSYMQTAMESGSKWHGDGGTINALLAGCRNPDRVFNRGAILAHRALAANERPLFQVAKHLLALGDLRGEALREILCEVVRIDPHNMEIQR